MDAVFESFLKIAQNFLSRESSGHDYFHAERVFRMALKIQETEGSDRYVIGIAAIMHDIMRPWEKETKKSHFWAEALGQIEVLLREGWIDEKKLPEILSVIARHDEYDWSDPQPKSLELQIVQDADNLDAIWALWIARTFMYAGAHNCPMWVPWESLDFDHDYIENGTNTSIIRHFYEKLLKLADNMNTETGKEIGLVRHAFMEKYVEQFFNEWAWNI